MRGYVYAGSSLMAVQQQGGVFWMHEDPITKSKRVTDINGTVVSAIETDPWGADTNRSSNQAFQPKRFTSYDRDGNQSDEAMFRRYNRKDSRFVQPDPYGGSYNFTDPQSFNRYAYVQNDPVNFTDPSGLDLIDQPHWTDYCFSAAYHGCGSGPEMMAFADAFTTFMTFGLAYWDLPGNNNELARGEFLYSLDIAGVPRNAHYLGGFSWGWTDLSHEPFPSYTYSFKHADSWFWVNGEWEKHIYGYRYNAYGEIIGVQPQGVETDWNAQLAIGGLLNGSRGLLRSLLAGLSRNAARQAATFASGQLEAHFAKHGAEFGFRSAAQYLQGAQALIRGGPGIQTFIRANGDTLFYRATSNEFAVLSRQGVIRTYFSPREGIQYWLRQIGR